MFEFGLPGSRHRPRDRLRDSGPDDLLFDRIAAVTELVAGFIGAIELEVGKFSFERGVQLT
jgi:hypothetical protein